MRVGGDNDGIDDASGETQFQIVDLVDPNG